MELSIEQYVATSNPVEAKKFVVKYGLPPAKSWSDLLKKMQFILNKHKDTAFTDLATIDTPYKHLVTDVVGSEKEKEFQDKYLAKEKEIYDKLKEEVEKKNEIIKKAVEENKEEVVTLEVKPKTKEVPKHLIDFDTFANYFKMSNADGAADTKKEVIVSTPAPVTEKKDYTKAIIASVAIASIAFIAGAIIMKGKK